MGCPCTGGTVHKNRKIACMYVEAAKLGQQSMNPKVNKQTITIRIALKYWNYFFKLIVFLVSLLSVNIFLIYYYSGNIQSFKTKKLAWSKTNTITQCFILFGACTLLHSLPCWNAQTSEEDLLEHPQAMPLVFLCCYWERDNRLKHLTFYSKISIHCCYTDATRKGKLNSL